MRRCSILCIAAAAAFTVTGFSETAYAIKSFSQKYQMKCEGCHSTVPKLNEFGAAFMAKGFVLPGQEKPEKQDTKELIKGERTQETTSRKADMRGRGTETECGEEDTASADKNAGAAPLETTDEDTAAPAPTEMIPTVVYKVPSQDGSIYYTDNPTRRGSILLGQESDAGTTAEANGRKVLPPRKKPAGPVVPLLQATGRETAAEETKPERYRNYSECMERQLEDTPTPQDAQEIMDLFGAAEKKCAPYQAGKR